MDTSVDACTDFFQYANGNWLKNTEIPVARITLGNFQYFGDNNNAMLKDILENAAKAKSGRNAITSLSAIFTRRVWTKRPSKKPELTPLKPYFAQINKIKTAEDLQTRILPNCTSGMPAVFRFRRRCGFEKFVNGHC